MARNSLGVDIFVFCDTALISKENKLSIIGIFDQIITDKLPFNFPKMSLVAVIGGQPQSPHTLQLTITDPAGKIVTKLDMQVTLGAGGSSNLISEITNFPLSLTGAYKISLSEGKQELLSKQLNISKTTTKSPLSS
jgi:hypothetical protein